MSYPHQPIPVTIGGREMKLRYTLRALKELQAATGESALKPGGIIERLETDPDPDLLALFVWALLWKEEPRPTVNELLDELGIAELGGIMAAVQSAQRANLPEARDDADPPMAGSLPQ